MQTVLSTAAVGTVLCACGALFVPPSVAPCARRCRKCHKAFQKQQTARAAAHAHLAEKRKEMEASARSLRQAFLTGSLPEGATAVQNGRQVVVAHNGVSFTFYLPDAPRPPRRGMR